MPICTLKLVQLKPYSISAQDFISRLLDTPNNGLILASQIRFDVVTASQIDVDELLGPWHFLFVTESNVKLPSPLSDAMEREYTVVVGVPSRVLSAYKETDAKLKSSTSPALTGSLENGKRKSSAQGLELSEALERQGANLAAHHEGPITQLNLLHFNKGMKAEYVKYGQAFAKVGGRRGGNPKLVGTVVPSKGSDSSQGRSGEGQGGWWNEIALVHYPSIQHFNDMLAGEDYQEVNARHRQKALRDTVLMCTTEYDLDKLRAGSREKSKL